MRAATYERISDDRDGRSRSIEQQNKAGRSACQANGWKIVTSHSDPVSASRYSRKARPGWDAIVDDVRAGRVDVVVMWEPSRGDRKLTTWSAFLDACRERSVQVYIAQDGGRLYNPDNANDWQALANAGVDSAHESDKISGRVKRAMAEDAEDGKPFGRIPYGYRRRYDPVTRELIAQEPDPETAPVVREIVQRIGDGDSISSIRESLTERGIPTPNGGQRWPRETIRWFANSGVVYIGKRRHNGGPLLDGQWPPIVDE